ncbi:hypothetical protein [Carnobacterium maltaromaticum]|uniref:hypothetical protein n=1 Tax=Carnobacterium maltaromaticum TaxID=2751 RepID=UPI00295E4E00|nr:hypothetical protein [Carnobacterium maltaromaticum]
MRIEKNWIDCFIYILHLEVPSKLTDKRRTINRTVVLKRNLDFVEMSNFIKLKFGQEVVLLNADLWEDGGLLIKEF